MISRFFSSTVRLLSLLVPLLSFGCYKAATGTSAPGYGYADEEYYARDGAAQYDSGADVAEAESVAVANYDRSSGSIASRGRSKQAAMLESRREFAEVAPAKPPATEATPDTATVELPEQAEPKPEPTQQASAKRQIIYTATMQVGVHDVEHAIAVAEALPERLGGWLHQRTDNQLILRIPAEKLEAAMAEIAELGVVDYRLLEALDVTAQYTDLESRIKVLEEMQTQLAALLAQAKDVEQALEIREALDAITLELELARGQMRELAKSIAFSTLVLRFIERGPGLAVPSSNDPFTWVDELGVEITEYR